MSFERVSLVQPLIDIDTKASFARPAAENHGMRARFRDGDFACASPQQRGCNSLKVPATYSFIIGSRLTRLNPPLSKRTAFPAGGRFCRFEKILSSASFAGHVALRLPCQAFQYPPFHEEFCLAYQLRTGVRVATTGHCSAPAVFTDGPLPDQSRRGPAHGVCDQCRDSPAESWQRPCVPFRRVTSLNR